MLVIVTSRVLGRAVQVSKGKQQVVLVQQVVTS